MKKVAYACSLFFSACGIPQGPESKLSEVKKDTAAKYFTLKDSMRLNYCLCDSLYLTPRDSVFAGNGEAKLFTLKKRIAQCGLFDNYEMIYGLKFIYSTNKDTLKTIQKYFKGELIGEQGPGNWRTSAGSTRPTTLPTKKRSPWNSPCPYEY